MEKEWIMNDRITKKILNVIESCVNSLQAEIISVVVYGSKARGDRNSQNDYEFVVLVHNDIDLRNYIKLSNIIMLEMLKEKLLKAKILLYTPDIFEEILYNDRITGTFLYMICKENIIIMDKNNAFQGIKDKVNTSSIKNEGEFLVNCIEFAKSFGSDKWTQKWEKTLMQYNYLKKRRDI